MGGEFGGGWIHLYVWLSESLQCSTETITTLLIGYIPIQNKNLKKKRKESALRPISSSHIANNKGQF